MPPNSSHQEEQILVQGLKKGLQPLISKNLEQEQMSVSSRKKTNAISEVILRIEQSSLD